MTDPRPEKQPPKPPTTLPPKKSENISRTYEENFKPLEDNHNLFRVIDALLKRPAQVLYAIIHGKTILTSLSLLIIAVLCLLGIGLMMAGYSGGAQFGAVPLKIITGTLLSGAICLPSLYILLCLSGSSQTFPQVCSILLKSLALSGILFIGFMPVAWIFSQATDSIIFMGILYLFIWGTGIHFGLRLLKQSFTFLNRKPMRELRLWSVLFVLVLLQMSTTLRPLLGTYEPLRTDEKKFFAAHWVNAIEHSGKTPETISPLPSSDYEEISR